MIHSRPFDFPYNGKLAPAATALLVIDMQIDFLSQDGYFAKSGSDPEPLRKILPNVQKLVSAARSAGCRIIWTRQGWRADLADMSPYDHWRGARGGFQWKRGEPGPLLRGSPGFEIVADLVPANSDIVIDKTGSSAFYETELDMVLRAQGITHLLFTGCTTDVCVHSSLRDATDRKYQCLLVEDACASGDAYAHTAAVHMVTIEDGVFGVVANSAAVIDGLANRT